MRRLSHVLLMLVGAALLGPGQSNAQSVSGQIQDEATGTPVSGVTVTLLDSMGAVVGQQTTESDGRFALTAPGPGMYRLRFQVPGYRVLASPLLEIVGEERMSYPVRLRAMAPALLDTLLVEGRPVPWNMVDFYRRRRVGIGHFATRDEWNRWAVLDIDDVVRHLNPFLRAGGRSCTGWPVYLDGAQMPSGFPTDDLFLDNFEAIEVHRSPTVPPDFDRPFGVCGATVLWSRLDLAGRTTHLDVGVHAGTAVAGVQGGRGRVGFQASLALGGLIELFAAYSSIVGLLDPASVTARSGWELIGAFRARPLGQETGWYVGLGGRAGGLRETASTGSTEEQHLVVLSGLELLVGRFRPFVELQVLGPQSPGSAVVTGFLGASARIY